MQQTSNIQNFAKFGLIPAASTSTADEAHTYSAMYISKAIFNREKGAKSSQLYVNFNVQQH